MYEFLVLLILLLILGSYCVSIVDSKERKQQFYLNEHEVQLCLDYKFPKDEIVYVGSPLTIDEFEEKVNKLKIGRITRD
ncbi:hypothetical protein [Companilactobacillus metriopterae]|uniref:hypothetical protein n=1 Tax=Companilactobacillus metriopterae TaxID=1909267 RepID=UPI00100A7F32|nr:hypothetical protein [Companilactobacillus metriopterae]